MTHAVMLAYFQCLTCGVLTTLKWAGQGWKNPAYVTTYSDTI